MSQLEAQKESMLDSLKRQSEASAEQQSEACKEQFPDLSELRTKVAKAHGMLFLLFVEKVTAESQDSTLGLVQCKRNPLKKGNLSAMFDL